MVKKIISFFFLIGFSLLLTNSVQADISVSHVISGNSVAIDWNFDSLADNCNGGQERCVTDANSWFTMISVMGGPPYICGPAHSTSTLSAIDTFDNLPAGEYMAWTSVGTDYVSYDCNSAGSEIGGLDVGIDNFTIAAAGMIPSNFVSNSTAYIGNYIAALRNPLTLIFGTALAMWVINWLLGRIKRRK